MKLAIGKNSKPVNISYKHVCDLEPKCMHFINYSINEMDYAADVAYSVVVHAKM